MSTPITAEAILIEFAKTVKAAHFYPEGHPNLEAVIEKTFSLLKDNAAEKGSIKWGVERSGFLDGRLPLGRGHKSLESLAKELFLRKIREITFTKDATLKEWKDFIFILKMDIDGLKKAGGLENLFVSNEIKGIQLNEMKYEDIRKKVIELEEAKKQAEIREKEAQAETKEQQQKEQEEAAKNIEEQIKDIEESEETIEVLLDKLEKEENTTIYNTLAQKITEKAQPLYEEKNWEGIFPVLIVFAAHSSPDSRRDHEQRNIASDKLKRLLSPYMTAYLATKICNRKEERRKEIRLMLFLLGEDAMKQLLTALIDTEDAYARRQIFNTLAIFGEMVRLEAEKRLEDGRWFVVRQMVSLLGEIGSPHSLEAIKTAFGHKDMRVKKEVLKAVGKIPSNESAAFLLQRLDENNIALKLQAIMSLGLLKDQSSVAPLGKLALKAGFFSENVEIRKEAVRSISMIGGGNAIAILKNLLKKLVFWRRKENDEVRSVAAIALGKIGGKDAMEALEETCQTSKGIVHIACKKALEGIK